MITDPDPDHPKGMHPNIIKRMTVKTVAETTKPVALTNNIGKFFICHKKWILTGQC